MREVDLITTKVEKIGVTEDRDFIQRYRLPLIQYTPSPEAAVPIDCEIDLEQIKIRKLTLNDGRVRYYAIDKDVENMVEDMLDHIAFTERTCRRLKDDLLVSDNIAKELRDKHRGVLELYNKNICGIRRMNLLGRMKFLVTGIINQ